MKRLILILFLPLLACTATPEPAASTEELTLIGGLVHQDIDVPTVHGPIHTEVVYSPGARLRGDRVVLMIPGTLANGAGYYDILPGTGYNAAEILADAHYVAVLIDLPGTGLSYRPPDGRTVTSQVAAQAVSRVALAYSWRFPFTDGFSVYGETGVGTNTALLLAREPWVRSVVASAVFYREFGPGAGPLFDPAYVGYINSWPTGYVPQDPDFIANFFPHAAPAVGAAAVAACLGPLPQEVNSGAFQEIFDIPFTVGAGPFGPVSILSYPIVDAGPARADALFIQGTPDPIGSEPGTAELAAAYGSSGGGDATVATLTGDLPNHLMRFDTGIADGPSSPFWAAMLNYLDLH
jgi:pimeloyl-ACP methyl ester carboxylesterase